MKDDRPRYIRMVKMPKGKMWQVGEAVLEKTARNWLARNDKAFPETKHWIEPEDKQSDG